MDDQQLLRYSRQIMLPEFDIAGQEKLLSSSVLIVGMGGLGCPAAIYLAAAGVGHLVLADDDKVDLTNLQRQIAHTSDSVGEKKVASANRTVKQINSGVRTTLIDKRLEGDHLREVVADVDLVVDASDNFTTRFAINEACVRTTTPLVSGAAIRLEGQVTVINPAEPNSPCYHCLYEDAQDGMLNCAESGVLAPVVGIIGTIQALEAIKLLTGLGKSLTGYLLVLDAYTMDWRKLRLPKNPDCSVCGTRVR